MKLAQVQDIEICFIISKLFQGTHLSLQIEIALYLEELLLMVLNTSFYSFSILPQQQLIKLIHMLFVSFELKVIAQVLLI